VDDAPGVRGVEAVGDLNREPDRVHHGELLLPVDPRPQGLAFHVRHHVVEDGRDLVQPSRVEQRKDVGMLEVRRDVDLVEEPLGPDRGAQLRSQHLHGDGAVVGEIFGEVDRRHPAPTELALDAVPAGESGAEAIDDVSQEESRAC
jgi:hypothetical protein